jgi:hypothetical protein
MDPQSDKSGRDVTPIPVRHDERSTPDPDTGTYRFRPLDPQRESDPDGIMMPLVSPKKRSSKDAE